jgi:hypothetical protein
VSGKDEASSSKPGRGTDGLLAALALPDADSGALDGVLAAPGAGLSRAGGENGGQHAWQAGGEGRRPYVGAVLPDLHLLDGLTERGSVTDSVLSSDSDLFRALGHAGEWRDG